MDRKNDFDNAQSIISEASAQSPPDRRLSSVPFAVAHNNLTLGFAIYNCLTNQNVTNKILSKKNSAQSIDPQNLAYLFLMVFTFRIGTRQ